MRSAVRIVAMPIDSASCGTASVEQRRVGARRARLQPCAMGPRQQRARRLVEADVPVQSQAQDLQTDAAGSLDRAFVAFAFAPDVACRAVEKMNAAPGKVDVIEQMPLHERAVAVRIVCAEADELVEVERRGSAEISGAA